MADLLEVLPDFDIKPFSHLIHSLHKNDVTTVQLLSSDSKDIARRCPLPAADVQKLVAEVIQALQHDVAEAVQPYGQITSTCFDTPLPSDRPAVIRTLDETIDSAMNGGVYPGHITEIAGESATGKTQFCLSLLLSVQLPMPQGLGKGSIYVSTEGALNTRRLSQILAEHPELNKLPLAGRPSLDNVHTITVSDLEAQEHIIRYQLPLAVKRHKVGLVVLDSVTANFRAEYGTSAPAQLADRALELTKLGNILRRIAIEDHVAVVVTNQVSDRFDDLRSMHRSSQIATSSPAGSSNLPPDVDDCRRRVQSLDHQQRFFTGWGGEEAESARWEQMKTPALGLAWANQISARIVLKMGNEQHVGANIWQDKKRRRTFGVVFAPWASVGQPIQYEITMQGVVSVHTTQEPKRLSNDLSERYPELLDEQFWDKDQDEEFP
jgi:DNA repair protein RAD57